MTGNGATAPAPLRVGVVGLGFTGRQHLLGYSETPGVEITALAGLEPGPLAELAGQYAVPHTHDRWEDLVARDDLDAVSICTPNHLHAPIAVAALEAGRHVLCEKPLARTADEAAAMVRAARAADRVLEVCFNHRHRADVAALKHQLDAGTLGEVYLAKSAWTRRSGIPGGGGWFSSRELSGGGPLIDLGVHMLDLALYLLGEPAVLSVSASVYDKLGSRGKGFPFGTVPADGPAPDVEDIATAFLRLEGGATLLLETSWAGYASPSGDTYGVTLFGTEGGARLESRNYATEDTLDIVTEVGGVPADVRPALALPGARLGHRGVVRDFTAAVRSGDRAGRHGEAALVRSRVIEACYTSARERREIHPGAADGD